MAQYRFICCGETIFFAEENAPSVMVEHTCGGVPCLACAMNTSGGAVPESDIASPELDAALDLVATGTEDVSLVPVAEETVVAEPEHHAHEIEQKSME